MREETITALRRHLKAVISKRAGQAIGLWGEAGVGKTFTVQALLRETPLKSLSLHSTSAERALAQSLPRPSKLPLWAGHILERTSQGQHVEAQRLMDALAAGLSALAPFVLHLEDIHEADSERLEFILKLARVIPRLRGVGLLVTSRSEPPEPFKSYRLGPLERAQADGLLQAQARIKLPPEGLDWVFSRTQGNPLFILEFWRYLTRQGFFWSDGQSWHWRKPPEDFVPASIEALIAQMVWSNLGDPAVRAVLEARAMVPGEFEFLDSLWASVAGVDTAALVQAQALLGPRGFLRDGQFVHPLLREVVEHETPPQRKRTYAERALEALQQEQPEQAAHFIELAQPEAHRALKLLERAAHQAGLRGDGFASARWQAEAVRWAYGEEQRTRALEAGRAMRPFNLARALELAEIAVRGPTPDPEAVLLCAQVSGSLGRVSEVQAWLQKLPDTPEARQRGWELLIATHNHAGNHIEALRLWNAHPELQETASPLTWRQAGTAYAFTDQLSQAMRIAEMLLERTDLSGEGLLKVRNLLGQVLNAREDWPRLAEEERRTIALARSLGATLDLGLALFNHAATCSQFGDRAGAEAHLREARAQFQSLGDGLRQAMCDLRLAVEMAEGGAFAEAEATLLETHESLARMGPPSWIAESHLRQAALYLTWQPPHGPPLALKHARMALSLAQAGGDAKLAFSALTRCTEAEVLCGHAEAALRLAQELLALASENPVADRPARAGFAYGLALEACGRRDEAREAVLQSKAWYEAQGESKTAQRYALEADRMSGDLEGARGRYEWLVAHGFHGAASLALRYFPQLAGQEASGLAVPAEADPRPYLRVLGPPQLEQSGQPLAYRAKKRLELLCYLLEARIAGREEVSVLELGDVFYPGAPEAEAKATLKQQVYLIRVALGKDSVHSTSNGYALGTIGSDAEAFLQTGEASLWRGAYLEHLSEGWLGGVREALVQALYGHAKDLLQSNPAEAARLGQILMSMEPYDTQFLQLALQANLNPKAAARLYKEAQARFLEVGESLPARLEDFLPTVSSAG